MILLAALLAGLGAAGAPRGIPIDPMTALGSWQVGGDRINYMLGRSSLTVAESPDEQRAPCFLLACDYEGGARFRVSAYARDVRIPGRCESLSFEIRGEDVSRTVEVAVEDADGRWYRTEAGTVPVGEWARLNVAVGDLSGWRSLHRLGEEPRPPRTPLALRAITVLRASDAPDETRVWLRNLTAVTDAQPADLVRLTIDADRPGNLFREGEPIRLRVTLTNPGDTAVTGRVSGIVTGFFGESRTLTGGPVRIPPNGEVRTELPCEPGGLGSYEADVVFRSGSVEVPGRYRFGVASATDPEARAESPVFGACGAVHSFPDSQLELAFERNRQAGIRWGRYGFDWGTLEPRPGHFAWAPPRRVTGDTGRGKALATDGAGIVVPASAHLALRDELTLAFRIRAEGSNANWQWPVSRPLTDAGRSYGIYLGKDDGRLCFTGGFEGHPDALHTDFPSGLLAWDGQWHHVAVTYRAADGTLSFSVDGRPDRVHVTGGGRLREDAGPLVLGAGFAGAMDDVALYRRVLNAEEIGRLAAGGPRPEGGLVGHWAFDDPRDPGADTGPLGLTGRSEPTWYETRARLARERGMRVLGILGFPPPWASSAPEGAARPWAYRPDLAAWERHVEAVTRHFRGTVDHWEIWNEPNITVFWEPEPAAEAYLPLVRAGYAAAKRGNPDCTVVAPGLAGPGEGGFGAAYLDDLIRDGLAQSCDAVSIHPYRQEAPEERLVEDLTRIVDRAEENGARRPLWITEWCWTTQIGGGSSEERSAAMLARGIALALGTGSTERILWFRLHDPGYDRFYSEHNYGLCYPDFTPKPAFFAYRTCVDQLDGTVPTPAPATDPGLWARQFAGAGSHRLALWSPDGPRMAVVETGARAATVTDLMGNRREVPTLDGLLPIRADSNVRFVSGQERPVAAVRALLLPELPGRLRIGGTTTVAAVARNPFPAPFRVRISLEDPVGKDAGPREANLPSGGEARLEWALTLPASTVSGRGTVTFRVELGELAWTETAKAVLSGVDSDAGPVGRWPLADGAGGVARDVSGNGLDGTAEGGPTVPGPAGRGVRFGSAPGEPGRKIRIPDCPELDLSEEVTLAFGICLDRDTGTWQFPVTKFLGNVRRNYGVYIRPGDLVPAFSASFDGAPYPHADVAANRGLAPGTRYHLAVTCSVPEGRVRLYIDGEPAGEGAIPSGVMLVNDEPLSIGEGTAGTVDDVLVYPRALTPDEIRSVATP